MADLGLSERETEFLVESTRIKFLESNEVKSRKGILRRQSLPTISHGDQDKRRADVGYTGAYIQMRRLVHSRQPIALEELGKWQKLIVDEQKEYGMACDPRARGVFRGAQLDLNVSSGNGRVMPADEVTAEMVAWERDFNGAALKCMLASEYYRPIHLVEYAAVLYQRFEKIAPFGAANGCMARLLFNYFTILLKSPLFVFRVADQEEFWRVRDEPKSMQRFVAERIRLEAPCKCGVLMERVHTSGWIDSYLCRACQGKLSIPRYALRPYLA
jgi:hypothetical protein